MATADFLRPFRKPHDDDAHDHIGSGASTPPNAATPQPDFVDKRLPGIVNSYFQVRDSLRFRSKSTANSANPAPPKNSRHRIEKEHSEDEQDMAAATTQRAPATPTALVGEAGDSSEPDQPSLPKRTPQNHTAYPTPPLSNSSSFHAMTGASASGTPSNGAQHSRKRSWHQRRQSLSSLPIRLRRHTMSYSSTLSNVVTKPLITGHISNPATTLTSPTAALHSSLMILKIDKVEG